MSTFWKIFGGFWLIWLIWYFTGGPQRSDTIKPYVRYDYDSNTINKSDIDLQTGSKEILPINTTATITNTIQNNLQTQSFTR